jgi:hypothetical protein
MEYLKSYLLKVYNQGKDFTSRAVVFSLFFRLLIHSSYVYKNIES